MSHATNTGLRQTSVVVAGVRSPVLEAGPSNADEAAVFVHGNPGPARDWAVLAARAGAFGRAVAPDMPGFGDADKPAGFDYTVPGYARHLKGVLGELGIRRAHLVLHDFGGPWGLAWAAEHPDAFASAVLINTGVLLDYRWHYLARIWRTPVVGELFLATTTLPGLRLALRHGNPKGLPAAYTASMLQSFKDPGTRRAILRLYRATSRPGEAADQLAAALRPLNRPALVVWGAGDPYIPVRYARRQQEVFAGARVVILEASGHWPFIDDPDGVARAVLPFLREQLGAGQGPPAPLAENAENAENVEKEA